MAVANNLLFLSTEFPPQPGGIGNHALHLATGLHKNGYNVHLICDQRSPEGIEEQHFDNTLPFQVTRIKRKKPIVRSYLKRIQSALKLARKNEIVFASGKFSLWLGAFLKIRYPRKKYIAVLHGSEARLGNPILRQLTHWSLKKYDTVIAVSNFTASLVADLSLKRVVVIPNGFEMNLQISLVKKPSDYISLITVGNVTERKGQHNIIAALPTLLKSFPNLQYHIVGIPTEKEKLVCQMNELKVADAVVFHGKVSEKRKQELLLNSDIFVMLSENTKSGDVEGFGIAILEGNSLGLPSIGALGCGIEDAVKEGYSGKLIHNKEPLAFSDAIQEIMNNYETYSSNAVSWSKNFSWDKIILSYIEVLRS